MCEGRGNTPATAVCLCKSPYFPRQRRRPTPSTRRMHHARGGPADELILLPPLSKKLLGPGFLR